MNLIKFVGKFLLIIVAVSLLSAGCNKTATQTPNNTDTLIPTEQNTSTISYPGEDGKNSLEILKAKYSIETKNYPGVGEFVYSINNTAPDSNHFWAFYVNGISSNVGAEQYITKSTDIIEWRLEEIKQ